MRRGGNPTQYRTGIQVKISLFRDLAEKICQISDYFTDSTTSTNLQALVLESGRHSAMVTISPS